MGDKSTQGISLQDVTLTDRDPNSTDKDGQAPIKSDGEEKGKPAPESTSKFVFVLTFFATLGGFLVGYDIGIVSGSMLYVTPHFKLTTIWTSAIVSAALGAAAVSSLAGGVITDRIGRRPSLLIGSFVFSVGGVLMGVAPNKEVLLAGRLVTGLGIGLASVVVPVYVAEASPVRMRGRLTVMWQMMVNIGILVSSLVAGSFSSLPQDSNWRYMLGLSAVPGVIQFFGVLFMPESPRWLVDKGRMQQAQGVLVQTRGYTDVQEELADIQRSVDEAKTNEKHGCSLLTQIATTPHVRRALVVGVGLLVFQQWCGINTAIYYSGTVMKMAGFPAKSAVWLVVLPNALLFLAGLIGIFVVDRLGRRPLLIWSMVGTIAGLVVIAVGFQLAEMNVPKLDLEITETYRNGTVSRDNCYTQYSSCAACIKDDSCGFCNQEGDSSGSCLPADPDNEEQSLYGRCGPLPSPSSSSSSSSSPPSPPSNSSSSNSSQSQLRFAHGYCPSDQYSWIPTIGVAFFVFAFSPGMAPMPWTINAEIYPLWARGTCTSIAATSAWVSNLIISFTFLLLTENITTYGTFWMFTGFSVLGLIFFWRLVPETKGKSLEEVEQLFMDPQQLQDWRAARHHRDDTADGKDSGAVAH